MIRRPPRPPLFPSPPLSRSPPASWPARVLAAAEDGGAHLGEGGTPAGPVATTAPAPLGGALGARRRRGPPRPAAAPPDRKSTRLNSSHGYISYAVFCLKKKK